MQQRRIVDTQEFLRTYAIYRVFTIIPNAICPNNCYLTLCLSKKSHMIAYHLTTAISRQLSLFTEEWHVCAQLAIMLLLTPPPLARNGELRKRHYKHMRLYNRLVIYFIIRLETLRFWKVIFLLRDGTRKSEKKCRIMISKNQRKVLGRGNRLKSAWFGYENLEIREFLENE